MIPSRVRKLFEWLATKIYLEQKYVFGALYLAQKSYSLITSMLKRLVVKIVSSHSRISSLHSTIFQQDGALAHYRETVRDYLDQQLPNR